MANYQRLRGRQIAALALLLAIAIWRAWSDHQTSETRRPAPDARGLRNGIYEVERVVDGDTLILISSKRSFRVRLQGINTPETVKEDAAVQKWGPEATAFTKAFIRQANGEVRVEVDGEARDQYDRHLAFVWDGGKLLNEELVRAGLAHAKLGYNYSQAKKTRLRRAQQQAQDAGRGVWSDQRGIRP